MVLGPIKPSDPGIVQKPKPSAEILKKEIAKKDADMNKNKIMRKDGRKILSSDMSSKLKPRSTAGDGSNIHPDFGMVGSATHGKIGK
jgi:hypothetical protein